MSILQTKSVTIAYFSGMGCTKMVAECFEKQFLELGITVNKIVISSGVICEAVETDLLIVLSPVHAFRLADIVEKWVANLPETSNTSTVVISVSAGGEVSPNTACRVRCKRLLLRKGYSVVYEKMLIMPSTFAKPTEPEMAYSLILILPQKVKLIIAEILSGKKNITNPKIKDRLFAFMGKMENFGAKFFGASIHASKNCSQCGLCIRDCPKNNIKMINGAPRFGFNCLMCLKCIYKCPRNALSPRMLKFFVLEDGFNLRQLAEKAEGRKGEINHRSVESASWNGAKDYLNN